MPKLYIQDESDKKDRAFDLEEKTIFIGRSATNDIQIKDLTVSRKHLKIYAGGEMNIFFIEDLKSTNGTFIGGDLIEPGEAFQVDERDTITIGNTVLHLQGVLASSPLSEKDAKAQHPKIHTNENEGLPTEDERRSTSPKAVSYTHLRAHET